MQKSLVVIFMKFPAPGRVKTRLATALGAEGAAHAYAQLAATTLAHLATPPKGQNYWIAYDPPDHREQIADWLRGNAPDFPWHKLHPQSQGDLGARLWEVVQTALVIEKAPSVTLIGTDCPWIRPHHLTQAQHLLDTGADIVFGPAKDGGYYLQAMKSAIPEMFSDIPWSTPTTLQTCLARAGQLGLRVALLEELPDVDTPGDWESWQKELSS